MHAAERATQTTAATLTRPRGHNLRWLIILVIVFVTITNYLDRGNLSVVAPVIGHQLHLSDAELGVALSAFVWPYAIANLPLGWATDRVGTKILMSIGIGAWSIVAMVTGFARSLAAFVVLRVLLGIGEAPMFPASLKAADHWFPDTEKAAATSTYIAATQVGLAISPPLATVILLAYGWPAVFVIMGAIGFIGLAGWLIIYHTPERHPWLHADEATYIRRGQLSHDEADVERPGVADWVRLFRHPQIWTMMIGGFGLQYVFWFYITWLPSYLEKAQHFSISRAGWLAALPYIAGTVAVLLGGWISDRLVRRGMQPFTARRLVITAGALLTTITLFLTAISNGPTVAVVLLTIGMFTYSLSSGVYWALAANITTSRRMVASIGSIQNFGGFLGGACAPIATGILVGRFGGFFVALLVAAALTLLSAVMYGLLLRRRMSI